MRTRMVCVAAALLAWCPGVDTSAAVLYRAVDLGAGEIGATATDINDLGQVVGWCGSGGDQYAFRTGPNQLINPATDDLGSLTLGSSYAYGINNLGQVVGGVAVSGHTHAFRTGPNQPINPATDDLGTLGGTESGANAINDRGEVVGLSMLPGDRYGHGFRTAPNLPISPATDDLGSLGGLEGVESHAMQINELGQVTGWAARADQWRHAFRTAPDLLIASTDDLGTLGGMHSSGTAINNYGQVAGTSSVDSGLARIFRTAPNQPIDPATDDLGILGDGSPTVHSMNDQGDIVGWFSSNDEMRAFVILGSTMYDLNELVEGDLIFEEAHGINNAGQIVANSNGHAYRLDPVPEPSIFLLLGTGLVSVMVCLWRKWR